MQKHSLIPYNWIYYVDHALIEFFYWERKCEYAVFAPLCYKRRVE